MYLMPHNSDAVNNRKWNLGRMGCNCSSRGIGVAPQKRLRGLHRLGDAGTGPYCTYFGPDGVTPESTDYNSNQAECASNGGTWSDPTASTTSAPGVPLGSVVSYTAQFNTSMNPFKAAFYSVDSVVAAVVQYLQQKWGISVTNSQGSGNLIGTPTVSIQVQTNTSYAALGDLKSILDGAFFNAAGAKVTGSQIAVLRFGSGNSASIGTPTPPATNPSSPVGIEGWLSAYWPLLVGGAVVLVVVKEL